jgi:uncharacterized membrane protein
MSVFGDTAFSVRLPSAIFSSLTTALIFSLGHQLSQNKGKRLGLTAALIFMASNYSTFLAHEARTYNLTLFLGVLTTLLFIRASTQKTTKALIIYGLSGGILCLSHFFGLWISMAQGLFWLIKSRGEKRLFMEVGWVMLGFAVTFGWYIPNLWHRFVDSASQGTWVNPAPWDAPYITLWKYLNTPIATIVGSVLLLWVFAQTFRKKTIETKGAAEFTQLIVLLFALPFFGQWILSLDHPFSIPMFTERYASISLPFLCLVFALSLQQVSQAFGQKISVIITTIFIGTIVLGKNFTPPNFAAARESLAIVDARLKEPSETAPTSFTHPTVGQVPLIIEPYHAAFQVLYYKDHKRFTEYHPNLIYEHLATQLSHSNVWVLQTRNSLDSLGLSQVKKLAYLHLGTEKSVHTQMIEKQLEKLTQHGGNQHRETIQLPKWLWGTWKDQSEAEFWLIDRK